MYKPNELRLFKLSITVNASSTLRDLQIVFEEYDANSPSSIRSKLYYTTL